jgi:hypothetical protein
VTVQCDVARFSPEQQGLWQKVEDLWAWSRDGRLADIAASLHPRYVGWDMTADLPHDREAALRSVSPGGPRLAGYELQPLSVEVYDQRVGVVHYAYTATLMPADGRPREVRGRWTEVYLMQEGAWRMISVSGRPNPQCA